MKSLRSIYSKLPREVRIKVRSFVPPKTLRWYAHRNTDVYLISYPKCGRTWLRLLIGRAITYHFQLPEDENNLLLEGRAKVHPEVPTISVIHDDRPMLKTPEELERSKFRFDAKSVILLVRDPRDVIVSSYFEAKNRGQVFGDNPYEEHQTHYEGSLSEFIHRKRGGFDTILEFYNIWADNRDVPDRFLLERYEDLQKDPHKELRKTLDFLGLDKISEDHIEKAVAFASFENMRNIEQAGEFNSDMLKPADKRDFNSYKTRKGKVGGYQEHLTSEEISRLNKKMQTGLSDIYGYTITQQTEN